MLLDKKIVYNLKITDRILMQFYVLMYHS